jgi:hypothetical protein
MAGMLAAVGINPRVPSIAMRHGWRRGAYLRYLRDFAGLEPAGSGGAAPTVRAEAVRRACRATIGKPIDFGADHGGACYLARGWSHPEADGVWSDGPSAALMFDVGSAPITDLRFEFSLAVFRTSPHGSRQVIVETNHAQRIDQWTLLEAEMECSLLVPASAWIGSRICLHFRFDPPKSPKELGLSEDPRALSIKLRRVCIHQIGVASTTSSLSSSTRSDLIQRNDST